MRVLGMLGVVLAAVALAGVPAHGAQGSVFTPVGPLRILDTRDGGGPVGPNSVYTLHVAGAGLSVPAGATEVVFTLTATDATNDSFVTAYADGTARPAASSLDFAAGQNTANLVSAPIGSDGSVDIWNHAGSVDLIADLAGYYSAGSSGTFQPVGPTRVLDTRSGIGTPGQTIAPIGQGATLGLQVDGVAGVPSTGVTAVVLDLVATNSTDSSFLTAYPDGSALPDASNLNFSPNQNVADLAVVPVTDGKVDITNHVGSVDVIADLYGYYTSGSGSTFSALTPTRVLDTRAGTGAPVGQIGPDGVVPISLAAAGVPSTATAVVVHLTAVGGTDDSFLTGYAGGAPQPDTSNLNFPAGQTVSNLAVLPVGPDETIDVWNHHGSVDVVADVYGYFG